MTPSRYSESLWSELIEEYGEERMGIRSGLYYNTDPLTSIYYVDHFFHQFSTFLSNCGMYFASVFEGPSMDVIHGNVVWFYERGSLTKSYRTEDLMNNPNRTVSTERYGRNFWVKRGTLEHNANENTLSLITADDRAITFDITTGEIIRAPIYRPPVLTTIAVAVLFAGVTYKVYKRVSKQKSMNND